MKLAVAELSALKFASPLLLGTPRRRGLAGRFAVRNHALFAACIFLKIVTFRP